MMSRRLLGLNVVLAILSLLFAASIGRQVTLPPPAPAPRSAAPARTAAPRAPEASPASPQVYSVITARNLFSPTRSEGPALAAAASARASAKPNLYGIILSDWTTVAYLEDPATKRVGGYRIGDAVSGGTIETIAWDRVVIVRPEGRIDVRLNDPARPRPAASPTARSQPIPAGAPGPSAGQQPPVTESPVVPPRRPGPPVLIRPPSPASPDATAQ